MAYKGMWPVSARDLVISTTWKELSDGSILISTISPPDDLYPIRKNYIRATAIISGMHIQPIKNEESNKCLLTLIGHSDLKGSIPSSVVNTLSTGVPLKYMTKLKTCIEKIPIRPKSVDNNFPPPLLIPPPQSVNDGGDKEVVNTSMEIEGINK